MSINVKPINEVPVIDALSEGDKLLVNSNGSAKQIDASKVGGSGGGGGVIIYGAIVGMEGETLNVSCHKSAARTESDVMTFVEFAELVSSGPMALAVSEDGVHEMYLIPMMLTPDSETSMAQGLMLMGTSIATINFIFPDSALN